MGCPTWLVVGVIFITTVLQSTSAFVCGNFSDLSLESQADIENKLAGCTTYQGQIKIGQFWVGAFVLPNLTSITSLNTASSPFDPTGPREHPSLTSIELPDLTTFHEMRLYNTPVLSLLSLPKVEELGRMIVQPDSSRELNPEVTLKVPLLFEASRMVFTGNFPRHTFYVSNSRLSEDYSNGFLPATASSPIAVDMPVLRQANDMHISGSISKISLPSLEILELVDRHMYQDVYNGRLTIVADGDPLDVTLPSLRDVTDISLSGNFDRVSFPALFAMNGSLSLEAGKNMSYNSAPLQRADQITLNGNITNFNVQSLELLNQLHILVERPVNCKPARAVWDKIHPDFNENTHGFDYYCYTEYTEKEKKKPFPKLAVGLSCGIGIPVWFFFLFALWHSRKAKKDAEAVSKLPPPDYEAEMAARNTGGTELLPDYEPRRSQRGQPDPAIELLDMTRPSPHPPGYDVAVAGSRGVVPVEGFNAEQESGRGGGGPATGNGSQTID
ncbi:uncharacterized protein RAG0_05648 [Rhynchosporium agropyri]|uniref:Uncharacterized protein n=1 Tax=Rhynchosporium agropyri TaxID=914238 RepID=A0A1E1KE24_9HELO|nr:uncharacterized protein RAG0_05648 [Rhynchosporium agropyri]